MFLRVCVFCIMYKNCLFVNVLQMNVLMYDTSIVSTLMFFLDVIVRQLYRIYLGI